MRDDNKEKEEENAPLRYIILRLNTNYTVK